MYVCICVTNGCMYACIYVMNACMYYVRMYACIYVLIARMDVRMCMYISIYIYIYIYIYVCVCRIAVDVRQEVYCTAVKTGGRREWEFLEQRYHAAEHKPSESDVLLASLACTRHEWLLLT